MLTVGDQLPNYSIIAVKPNFLHPIENEITAFEIINHQSFHRKWKIIYFYPKDFTEICPKEILKFDALFEEFSQRQAVLLGGNSDNEYCKLAWKRENKELANIRHWLFSDSHRHFISALGVYSALDNALLRATLIIDADNIIQHISVNNPQTPRNPLDILKTLDAIQASY